MEWEVSDVQRYRALVAPGDAVLSDEFGVGLIPARASPELLTDPSASGMEPGTGVQGAPHPRVCPCPARHRGAVPGKINPQVTHMEMHR